ncbi:beta-ketoacyl synthase domain-containing protein [Astrocystis sublimbata]|nr:beta-ketoacyl synthase domain-containing protein [Astrocystis sublimbata]
MAPERISSAPGEPIAIVGSGCRFPGGATTPSKLWELLREPVDVSCHIPPSRFNADSFHHADHSSPGHCNVRRSYLLQEDVADFDAQFFNLQSAEAAAMDPQQRVLLETVYEGLETAGLTLKGLRGSNTGVYVGMMYGDYESLQYRDLQNIPTYHGTGTARSIVSNRISYFFDWHGPSLTLDTACSSSLVALHQAVQALRSGEVDAAVAAGTNLLLGPEPYIYESKLQMLSPDGQSRMWDESANGYARGDGVACLILKTLSQALADGDNIEAVIRESGVNQDGRSRGITMPTVKAQVALIRETYARAGLDPTCKSQRCQYFEAHGTGTPAGDPVEAEAVHTAFFESSNIGQHEDGDTNNQQLLVGSIKTIIGHTESTSGIAGILKVVQAMKNRSIPPNLLLNRLNPQVAPWYRHLQIPQTLTPWPEMEQGQRRRASVNSFGFGGTNAHVIVEDFESSQLESRDTILFTPFVFSAQSKPSLLANLKAYIQYLKQNPGADPADLARTLLSRRSRLPLRVSFPASPIDALRANLETFTSDFHLDTRPAAPNTGTIRLLGMFTGQGAQWAQMGADLIQKSQYAVVILSELDDSLAQLPEDDRPQWSLKQEILVEAASSNVHKASVSQPLCTAIQIVLVKLLRAAGIDFAAVIGHSSGEIACAYAAGYLSASDAIRIAYYRGLHSRLACGPGGIKGAMLAVGTTLDDAEQLCNDEVFHGRVKVAACNSPSSVTLSGDEEAIEEMMEIFEDEQKFVRRLKVDTAYHSHHMIPCSQAYLESMRAISVSTARQHDSNCIWVSSVCRDQSFEKMSDVDAQYWVDNLLSPVLFKHAVERAASTGTFDGIIEVGPHPALKGPVRETLQDLGVAVPPYTGLLQRNTEAIESISAALGYLWSQVDNLTIQFDNLQSALGGPSAGRFIPDLPLYQWNHAQKYWHESSTSRNLRERSAPFHPLLGDRLPQSSSTRMAWKNILRTQDLPWVHDHQIQDQSVFPAAGYAITAIESATFMVPQKTIQLLEIEDLTIHQAMVLDNNDSESGIEIFFTLEGIANGMHGQTNATFTYESQSQNQNSSVLMASGRISVMVGDEIQDLLPATEGLDHDMIDIPTDVFYTALKDVGYGYTGPFKALGDLKRKLGKASGSIFMPTAEHDDRVLFVHPGVLDAAIHSIFLAHSCPRDGQLSSLHLPTHIRRIRVNTSLCGNGWQNADNVPFLASIPEVFVEDRSTGFTGDVEIHNSAAANACAIQLEGLRVVPFTEATESDDKTVFYATQWIESQPNADIPEPFEATSQEIELATLLERGHYFYLRQLEQQVPSDHPGRGDALNATYLNWAAQVHNMVLEGKHPYAKKEWLNDTLDDITSLAMPFSQRPEIRAMHTVGEQMPRAIRGETTMLEHLIPTGLLTGYYAKAIGLTQVTVLAHTANQIVQRYPQSRILEVGAGTGGATREVLKQIGQNFSSYTFTDVSTGFFEDAQTEFASFREQMSFRVLNLEQDMTTQGFEKQAYDVVVASLVLHTTRSLEQTCSRVRSLLKPGGYLILYEVTNVDLIRLTALFGCLPGWWQGVDEGRTMTPAVTESEWDAILRKTGFSGVDTMTPVNNSMAFCNSVLVSQAVDDQVEFLREPLLSQPSLHEDASVIDHLFIVGGSTLKVSRLAQDVQRSIQMYCNTITRVKSLHELDSSQVDRDGTVLVLQELDEPVFKNIDASRLEDLKRLFGSEKLIVWVSQNRLLDKPYSNMVVGFAQSQVWETPELRYQFIDFQNTNTINPREVAEGVLRFRALDSAREASHNKTLWSVESEIIIDAERGQLIPRLRPIKEANDRYNSAVRPIAKTVQPQDHPVVISTVDDGYTIYEQASCIIDHVSRGADNEIALAVSHSSLHTLNTIVGKTCLLLGNCKKTGQQYITISGTPVSVIEVPRNQLIETSIDPESAALFLRLVSSQLILSYATEGLEAGQTLVCHNTSRSMAAILKLQIQGLDINKIFTSTSREDAKALDHIYIDPFMRRSEVMSLLPSNITRLVDFGNPNHKVNRASVSPSWLPVGADIVNINALTSGSGLTASMVDGSTRDALEKAVVLSAKHLEHVQSQQLASTSIAVQDLTQNQDLADPLAVVDWSTSSLSLAVRPVKPSLKADKTYWLVGLSRDMGLSLADYLIENGAKYLAITSRSPQVNPKWLLNAKRRGATVVIKSCDVTDYDSVSATYEEFEKTMPPIAGIAQGAMVLRDVLTRDMKIEELTDVLQPKVDGSLNLDRLFHDKPLDFLVFFSSSAGLTGNAGQANYAAANFFMMSLARQRRRRGVAGSVIDLGPVLGIGYITREWGNALSQPLTERGLMGLSERDVHHAFAEAINASHPHSSAENIQITTGVIPLPASAPDRPLWYNFPHFAFLTVNEVQNSGETSQPTAGASIKERLAHTKSKSDVETIITGKKCHTTYGSIHPNLQLLIFIETFIDELRTMLHLSDDYAITCTVRTDELGLDSLVAVRIRSWFLKHYHVNIPALRIMRGVAIKELVDLALDVMPIELTPHLSAAAQSNGEPASLEAPSSSDSTTESSHISDTPVSSTGESSEVEESVHEKEADSLTPHEIQLTRFGRLSYTQASFRFTHELLHDKTTLNNTGLLHLKGDIRVNDLIKAVDVITQRHEVLRTCFCVRDGQVVQGVMEKSLLQLEHKRIRSREDLNKEYADIRSHQFDLASGRTARLMLLSHSSRDHYLVITTHHIIFDGASTDIFMTELSRVYQNQGLEIQEPLQHLDFSEDQYTSYARGEWKDHMTFWRNQFATIPEPLPLHRSSQIVERQPLESYKSWVREFRIDAKLANEIRLVARKYRTNPFHFHLAALRALLGRWLGAEDTCIMIADSSRRDERAWTALGPFINTLPLRLRGGQGSTQTFAECMVEARDMWHEVLEHAVPLDVILTELAVARPATHAPLAQAVMNYAEVSVESRREFLGCAMEMMREDHAELPYDIAFNVINNAQGETRIMLTVQASIYTEADAALIANGYEDILKEFVEKPEAQLGEHFIFREAALQKALAVGTGPMFESGWPATLIHRFEDLAPSVAGKVAVTDGDGNSLTYEQLSHRVNAIAAQLLKSDVKPGSRVAVCQHPSVNWPASVLAIMKIGAVYVPLDAATPVPRLTLIVDDCAPVAVLAHKSTANITSALPLAFDIPILDFSSISTSTTSNKPEPPVPTLAKPHSPAVILYTSGSTGTPKGVILSHNSLRHEFELCTSTLGLTPDDVILQQSAWSFDITISQLFLALSVGARLHIVAHDQRGDSGAIVRIIRSEGVSVTFATPTEYKSWLRQENLDLLRAAAPGWRLALLGGEAVTEALLGLFRGVDTASGRRLFNLYGPTETTCMSTMTELEYRIPGFCGSAVPAGKVKANESIYILDSDLKLLPVGQLGEVVIGGIGVATGYTNSPDQARAVFIPNPFAPVEYVARGWTVMYRTGDRGYLQEDGTLVLRGRGGDDTEVKIHGVRVDLRDVEQSVLRAAGGKVVDAVATLRTGSEADVKFIVVFVVVSASTTDEDKFLQDLMAELPLSYAMRPSAIIPVDELPRTVGGKLDRKAAASIPLLSRFQSSFKAKPDRFQRQLSLPKKQKILRDIWHTVIPRELVDLDAIGRDSDFFSVGGNSMQLIDLQHRISDKLQVHLPLIEMFKNSTLGSMARLLGDEDSDSDSTTKASEIDWDEETQADPESIEAMNNSAFNNPTVAVKSPPQTVVLTGATGFLGQYLLRELVRQESVQHVICIANRRLPPSLPHSLPNSLPNSQTQPPNEAESKTTSLATSDKKITHLPGDLRHPLLGLSSHDATRLFSSADAVIHNGADVSHLKTYATLRSANVSSTKELARLCVGRKIPLHYISTAGVAMYTDPDTCATMRPVSVRDAIPDGGRERGDYGYIASKWACEVFLENMVSAGALDSKRVFVHRPSSILRPAEGVGGQRREGEGETEYSGDILQDMLSYSRRLGAVPDVLGQWKGYVDLVRPENVARSVVAAVVGSRSSGSDTDTTEERLGPTFMHQSGDIEIEISDIKKFLEEEHEGGDEMEVLPLDEWAEKAVKAGLPDSMAAVFRALGRKKELNFPRLLKE